MIFASGSVAALLLGQGLLCYQEFPIKSHMEKHVAPETHCFPQGMDTFLLLH